MIRLKILPESKKSLTKLSVFDFDGTLFKNPDKPKGYIGNWWAAKESLNHPYVPKKPDDSFWNVDIVQKALSEMDDKNTYCILLTGRLHEIFDSRVKQLLSQKDLHFKQIGLNSFGNDTGEFKIKRIKEILKKHPTIKKIEMWDDEQDKIELYTDEFSNDYQFKINKVG